MQQKEQKNQMKIRYCIRKSGMSNKNAIFTALFQTGYDMKKGCILLLAFILLTYGYQGYRTIDRYMKDGITVKTSGKLSDIAGRATSVPLETPDSGVLRNIRQVRRDGDDLFLLSENRLLHFDVRGHFINRIAGDINAFIVGYALDTDTNQVIVIDSQRNISNYGYVGNLLSRTGIKHPWHRLAAFTFHDGYLWVAAETLEKNGEDAESYLIRQNLYRLDAGMNEVSRLTLRTVNAGRPGDLFTGSCISELLADEAGVYAYAPPAGTGRLLEDTLYIEQQRQIPLMNRDAHDGRTACACPVRKGKRYLISTGNNFTFCYDRAGYTAYILAEGFTDDIFGTGRIPDFQPVDIYSNAYYFVKSGKDLSGKFPERAADSDRPVLFLVNLNV
jgi:hypothetical protein